MLRIGFTAGVLLATTACTQLPRAEFQAYRDSFAASQTAATSINSDYAVAERAARMTDLRASNHRRPDGSEILDDQRRPIRRYTAADPYFDTFELTDAAAISTVGLPPGAAAIDRAFRGIAAYNNTLAALAENRNIDEAKGQLRQIITDVGGIVPVGAPVIAFATTLSDLVGTILAPAIEIDNREQFKQQVLRGYGPMIRIIDQIADHSRSQYRAIIDPLLARVEGMADGPDRKALIDKINAWQRVFADYVVLLDGMKLQLTELKAAVEHPREASVLARASAGAAELRAYAEGLRRSIDALRALP